MHALNNLDNWIKIGQLKVVSHGKCKESISHYKHDVVKKFDLKKWKVYPSRKKEIHCPKSSISKSKDCSQNLAKD